MVFYHLVLSTKQHSTYELGFEIGKGIRQLNSSVE